MAKHCGRLCGKSRDRRLVVERELAQFIRSLMQFVYPASSTPAEYEITTLLKTFECECADVDANLYRLHFGQFFRFAVAVLLQVCAKVACCSVQGTNYNVAASVAKVPKFDAVRPYSYPQRIG